MKGDQGQARVFVRAAIPFIVGIVLTFLLTGCVQAPLAEWLRRAEEGDPEAQYKVALAWSAGREIGPDPPEVARWLRRAAEQSNPNAQNDLGHIYNVGYGVPRDHVEAVKWFRRAAEQGHVVARSNLGAMYLDGLGVPSDHAEAVRWLRLAAQRQHAQAQRMLGIIYERGLGVVRDDAEALRWYTLAAHQGDAVGQFNVGVFYSQGRGGSQRDEEAVAWWRRAAAQGNARAQHHLGWAYRNGRAVQADQTEAALWFRQAAGQGLADAQAILGSVYVSGTGVPEDYQESFHWFHKAAHQGSAAGQRALGSFYELGEGVTQDLVQAYAWYHRAALQGDERAVKSLERLGGHMTAARVEEAKQLARETKPGRLELRPSRVVAAVAPSESHPGPGGPLDLIPRDGLFGNGRGARSPKVSPDGRQLAYLRPWNGTMNVWLRTVGLSDDRPLTRELGRDVRRVAWRCDGTHVLFFQDPDDDATHLYQLEISTGVSRDLTPDGTSILEGAGDCYNPDGKSLVAASNATVYRVDLRAGTLMAEMQNPGDLVEYLSDRHGNIRATLALTPTGDIVLRARDHRLGPWRVLQRWRHGEGYVGRRQLFAVTADDRSLIISASTGAPATRLLRLDLASGTSAVIAADAHHDVLDVLLHPQTREVQAVRFTGAQSPWRVVDRALRPDFDALRRTAPGEISVVSRDEAGRIWTVEFDVDDRPPRYFLYDRETRMATPLFVPGPALDGQSFAPMRPIALRARDGLELRGFLTLPVGNRAKGSPMVLLVHGGPWDSRDAWGFDPTVQWLANRGYTVLQVNFRGTWGDGKAHVNAGDGEFGGKMIDDLLDARSWAIEQGYTQTGRICIMGASYGGYAALAALTREPDAFACGVSLAGVYHLPAFMRSAFGPVRWFWDQRVGSVETHDATLRTWSPVLRPALLKSPVLIAHGTNDLRVPRVQSDVMVSALRSAGKSARYLVLPGLAHDWHDHQSRLRFLALTEFFLAQTLGGAVEPPAPHEEWKRFLR